MAHPTTPHTHASKEELEELDEKLRPHPQLATNSAGTIAAILGDSVRTLVTIVTCTDTECLNRHHSVRDMKGTKAKIVPFIGWILGLVGFLFVIRPILSMGTPPLHPETLMFFVCILIVLQTGYTSGTRRTTTYASHLCRWHVSYGLLSVFCVFFMNTFSRTWGATDRVNWLFNTILLQLSSLVVLWGLVLLEKRHRSLVRWTLALLKRLQERPKQQDPRERHERHHLQLVTDQGATTEERGPSIS